MQSGNAPPSFPLYPAHFPHPGSQKTPPALALSPSQRLSIGTCRETPERLKNKGIKPETRNCPGRPSIHDERLPLLKTPGAEAVAPPRTQKDTDRHGKPANRQAIAWNRHILRQRQSSHCNRGNEGVYRPPPGTSVANTPVCCISTTLAADKDGRLMLFLPQEQEHDHAAL